MDCRLRVLLFEQKDTGNIMFSKIWEGVVFFFFFGLFLVLLVPLEKHNWYMDLSFNISSLMTFFFSWNKLKFGNEFI